MKRVRLGTRASALAQWQARWIGEQLKRNGVPVQLVPIATRGDADRRRPVEQLGGTGLFTKAIQQALLNNAIDLAVHSLKDLPTTSVPGLLLAAVPRRAAVQDALICRSAESLDHLPHEAVIGTGSLRRRAQLLLMRKDLRMTELRGNVETRVKKLDDGQCDAVVLALAGLQRLGLDNRITHVFPATTMFPAVGQGALAVEIRADDARMRQIAECLDDRATHAAVRAERSLLAALQGGCLAPVGAWGRVVSGRLHLSARVVAGDGSRACEAQGQAHPPEAVSLGQSVAHDLIRQGAAQLIDASRQGPPPDSPGGSRGEPSPADR